SHHNLAARRRPPVAKLACEQPLTSKKAKYEGASWVNRTAAMTGPTVLTPTVRGLGYVFLFDVEHLAAQRARAALAPKLCSLCSNERFGTFLVAAEYIAAGDLNPFCVSH